jgi:hypothetical protein
MGSAVLMIDRAKFPTADDEYTPEQRRIIDVRVDQAEKGPYYGPFKNGGEIDAFLTKRVAAKHTRVKRPR